MPEQNYLTHRASRIATRWDLTLQDQLQLTKSRAVYKVETANGPAVLKLYGKLHCSGERAAVPFLRTLPDDIALKVYRTSPLRRAILMEWLDGPSLATLMAKGQSIEAEQHLANVAGKLAKVTFKNHLLYRKTRSARMPSAFKAAVAAETGTRQKMFQKMQDILDTLLKTTEVETIIHGDMQYQHAILTPKGPRLFDPKGLRADPAAEYRLVLIPNHHDTPVDAFNECVLRRATLFADATGIDRQRILMWATVGWGSRVMTGKLKAASPDTVDPYLHALLDLSQF
ncbi:aminoglycoside phosphotransferase family protein [Roseobacter sp. CCS2]|uniref:aminoglycoside phosphotransferase family protein n=1 Tax=Roseobacter sp. CCS2 TaxID=391593 RepID=UPI0000F4040A|nr:aminoglycoside phosphotransferase family protein [Roseobacter sp. CCS2]EBA13147.1 aminoglycoside/hydroxyurea antibiotic resistance kinase [Roseobacter sp. CCS2]